MAIQNKNIPLRPLCYKPKTLVKYREKPTKWQVSIDKEDILEVFYSLNKINSEKA